MANGTDDFSWLTDLAGAGDPGGTMYQPNDGGNWWDQFSAPSNVSGDLAGMIQNPDGTWTDPSTGIIYDQNGTSTGNTDPNYGGAVSNSDLGLDQNGNPIGGGGGSGAGGGGGLGGLGSLLSGLGGIPGLASILGPLLGAGLGYQATKQGTSQVVSGINNAQNAVTNLLGGQSLYSPYMNAGQGALGKLGSMTWTPLNYGPLGGTVKR